MATSDTTEKLYKTKLQNNVIYRITKQVTFVNSPCNQFRTTLFLTSAQYKLYVYCVEQGTGLVCLSQYLYPCFFYLELLFRYREYLIKNQTKKKKERKKKEKKRNWRRRTSDDLQ